MTSSTTAVEGRRRLGVPLVVLYVGLPGYVGAVGFSVVQIVSDNSALVSALAIGAIALFTVLLLWVQAQYQIEETQRLRFVLVTALAIIAWADCDAPSRCSKGFNETIRKAAFDCE